MAELLKLFQWEQWEKVFHFLIDYSNLSYPESDIKESLEAADIKVFIQLYLKSIKGSILKTSEKACRKRKWDYIFNNSFATEKLYLMQIVGDELFARSSNQFESLDTIRRIKEERED